MRRREFITLLGGTATAWPLTARAQQNGGMRRIGVLLAFSESDPEPQTWVAAFQEGLQRLGWGQGRNLRISRCLSSSRRLHRPHPQGCEAAGFAYYAIDQVRARYQCANSMC
jgi:hypothetical protein